MTDEEYKRFDYPKFVDSLRAHSLDDNILFDILHSAVGVSGEAGGATRPYEESCMARP